MLRYRKLLVVAIDLIMAAFLIWTTYAYSDGDFFGRFLPLYQ